MDLMQLKTFFQDKKCSRVLYKELAENDNSKNQFYIGGDFSAVSIIPCDNIRSERSGKSEHSKRTTKNIFKADIDFLWINDEAKLFPAPNVQLIMYPQYPEVRMTGFLKGCKNAPKELVRARQKGRILFLGICDNGKILGYLSAHDSSIASEIREQKELNQQGVFFELPLSDMVTNSKEVLISKLGEIHKKGWISGKRLKSSGQEIVYNASNAGGYTLEAELGVLPQGFALPDYLGWEIKQHKVSSFKKIKTGVITLMTPEPDAGYYKENGAEAFVRKYGRPDQNGIKDRINFGGRHFINKQNEVTELTLVLDGYNSGQGKIDCADGGICLTDGDSILAKWSYSGIIKHWKRKHSQAAYIPGLCKIDAGVRMYWYGPVVRLGEGTDILFLLNAMSQGIVYYDPGIKLENIIDKPKLKRRSQFRIHSRDIEHLYKCLSEVNVCMF